MDDDPWSVKFKRWLVIEVYVLKCIGFVKYFFQPFFSMRVLFKKDILLGIFQILLVFCTTVFLFWLYYKFLLYTALVIYLLSI